MLLGRKHGRFWLAIAMVFALLGGVVSAINPVASNPQQAHAAAADACTTSGGTVQSGLKVYPSHGKVFYIDSGQGQTLDAAYIGYRVENTGSSRSNLWAKVDTFTGGVVGLANAKDEVYRIGNIASAATSPAYFLMKAGTSTTRAQSHVFRVYDQDPRLAGASELYSCTYTFSAVKETIKAAANKVSRLTNTSTNVLGGTVTVTVEGESGTIGSGTSSPDGEVMWFTPAGRSSWPSGSLRLKSTQLEFFDSNSRNTNSRINTFTNQLVFQNPTTSLKSGSTYNKVYYTATYVFDIVGPVSGVPRAIPIAQISSGTQIKHTDVRTIDNKAGADISVSTPVNVVVTKTVSPTVVVSGSDREISYTVTLQNTGAEVAVDRIVDDPGAGLTYKANSGRFNSAVLGSSPAFNSDGNLVFSGPFTIPANSTRTLTYTMISACSSGAVSFTNFAFAEIADVVIGSSGSQIAGATLSGTCPSATGNLTAGTTTQTLNPEALTQPASSVGETTATLNGSVDPNGSAGLPITFTYSTSSALTGGTTVTLGTASTSGTTFYSVNSALTGLSPGTTYYFRVSIGSTDGEILSFTTTETPANPTVVTNSVTGITLAGAATLNGTFDPNQISGGATPAFAWGLTGGSGTESNCTNTTFGATTIVQEPNDTETGFVNVNLSGAFPTEVSLGVTGLTSGKFYCVKAIVTWSGGSAEGSPVLFKIGSVQNQTITFPIPTQTNDPTPVTLDSVTQTAQLSANSTSGLPITYTSNTPSVCTVSGSIVTIVGGGTCSLSADQPGDTDYYPANTVTITFSIPTYTVTYLLDGGSGSAPVDASSPYGKGATVTVTSTIPTKNGSSFQGWGATAGGGVTRASGSTFVISSDTTLVAQWLAAVTYRITYDANNGSGAPAASDHVQNTTATVSATEPVRAGYTFAGWNTQSGGGGTNYAAGQGSFQVSSNITLYAKWVANITYDGNSNTGGSAPTDSNNYSPGATATVASRGSLTRTDYTFDGWNTSADGTGTSYAAAGSLTVSGSQTLYAQWRSTVTYNANGGTGSPPSDGTSYKPGQSITILGQGTLEKTNLVFGGWNTNAGGTGTGYATGGTRTNIGSTTLFAVWLARLSYDSNPPGGSSATGSVPSASDVAPGAQATVAGRGTVAVANKVFDGWNTQSNGLGTTYQMGDLFAINTNQTLYALWLDEVVLSFDGNGNTAGSPPTSLTVGQGRSATLPGNQGTLSRSGFSFAGWNTQANGTGTSYSSSASVPVPSSFVLYAQWTQDPVNNSSPPSSGPTRTNPNPNITRPPLRPPSVIQRVAPPVVPPSTTAQNQNQNSVSPVPPVNPPQQQENRPAPALPGISALGPTPGNPSTPGSSGNFTIDRSGTPAPVENNGSSNQSGGWAQNTAVRTLNELAGERFEGFQGAVSQRVEVLGARTGARFVVTEATLVDQVALMRAIESSIPTQAQNFFAIDSLSTTNAPLTPREWDETDREAISEVFAASGLPAPRNLTELNPEQFSQWLLVQTRSSTYLPGTEVYLTLTSEPIVLGSAIVDEDGEAIISGTIPVELLTAGEHRIRLVGIRNLEGAYLDDEGKLQLTEELISEIERFDLGTQSTIAIIGEAGPDSGHVALRVVPLVPTAPWWTLWFLLGAAVIAGVVRLLPREKSKLRRWGSTALFLGAALPGIIIGWFSTVVAVTWWALGLGVLGAVLSAFGPYRHPKEGRRAEKDVRAVASSS